METNVSVIEFIRSVMSAGPEMGSCANETLTLTDIQITPLTVQIQNARG